MTKKMTEAICGVIAIISCGICTFGYVLGNSNDPWWLIVFVGGMLSGIIYMLDNARNEK